MNTNRSTDPAVARDDDHATAGELVGEGVGGLAGIAAGAAVGSLVGTTGTLVGALAGAVGGWWSGKAVANAALVAPELARRKQALEASLAQVAK